MLVLGPQPIAHARLQPPGPAGTLGGAGAGDALGVETAHAAAGVETRNPRQPGVDHHPHAIDGQAGLGNVSGQYHLALARRRRVDGRSLRCQVKLAMQRAQQHIAALTEGIRQLLMDPANLRLPRQEHQHAAGFVVQGFKNGLHQPRLDKFPRLERPPPAHLHRVHAPFTAQDRRVVEQPRQAFTFKGGGHQQDFQRLFIAKQLAAIEAQGQRQVGVEATLVEFVEDQQTHAIQCRVILQAPGEDAFGDHFNTGVGADLAVQADPVADGFPTFSPSSLARRSAAARAASRRGSSIRMVCPASQVSCNSANGTRVVLPAPGGASSTASWRVAKASRKAGKTSSIGNEFILAPKQSGEYNGERLDIGALSGAAMSLWKGSHIRGVAPGRSAL